MRKTAVGVIAVVTASAVLSVVGLGLANASPDGSVPTSGAALVSTIRTEAADLQTLHDQVQTTFDNKDVNGLYASAKTLASELDLVRGSATKAAMAAGTTDLITRARQLTGQLIQQVGQAVQDGVGLPDTSQLTSGLISSVMSLVASLLSTLMNLISSLLGGLPGLPGLPGVGAVASSLPVPAPVPGK